MRIGVNTLYLLPGKIGGSETYIANMIEWLTKLDKNNEYIIFVNNECREYFKDIAPNLKIVHCKVDGTSRPLRMLWEQFVLPFQIKKHNIDLLYSTGHTKPFYCPAKSVLVIFDMQHINQPEFFSSLFIFVVRLIIYISAKTADHIITISDNSKSDILNHYNIPSKSVTVTYLSANKDIFKKGNSKEIEKIKDKYSIKGRYLYYGAASLPHKNHKRLLNVFKTVKAEHPDLQLVLTGARDYGEGSIFEHIKTLGLEEDVVLLGWLPFEDVALIYSGAELFVFPSLHEGFGMPVLEAMYTETPVTCSDIEPLKEIVADGALLFDPLDEDSMKQSIVSILEDSELQESLIKKGIKRADFFSWEKTAKSTIEIFNSYKL